MSYLKNQILRGAETIRRNSMVTTDINEVSDTPRTDAYARHWPSETECVPSSVARQLERELAVSLENQVKTQAEVERLKSGWQGSCYCCEPVGIMNQKLEAEVERLRDLLNRAINEIEKIPFHAPKLTAFTAHTLADRYREKMTNTSTKPIESQEDDK